MPEKYLLEGYYNRGRSVVHRYAKTLGEARRLAREALADNLFSVVDISEYDHALRGWNLLYAVSRRGSRLRWARP